MSMSAKELLKFIGPVESGSKWEFCAEHQSTILRALSLLAAVLSSQDDVVCELRSDAAFLKRIGHPEEAETMDNAAARITLDAQEKAALKGQADVLDALNTSQAHEIALLKTKLASVKAERDALKERIWQIRVELGALFTMLPNEVPGLAMEVCERDADRQCLFRAFELAAHKEGA